METIKTDSGLGEIVVSSAEETEAESRKRLKKIAADMRGLYKARESATLEMAGHLYGLTQRRDFVYHESYMGYDEERRMADGELVAIWQFVKAEGIPFTKQHVGRLIAAGRINETLRRNPEVTVPTSAGQLKPLAPLLNHHNGGTKEIIRSWEEATEKAGGEQPSSRQVAQAAREIVPEAYMPKKKKSKSKSKVEAAKALHRLLDKFDRKALEAAWKEIDNEQ